MECGYNNYPTTFTYPRVYPNFPPTYYPPNLVPPAASLPGPVGGIPGVHPTPMTLNPEMATFTSEMTAQPFVTMNAVAMSMQAMSSTPHLDSTVSGLNTSNHSIRSGGQAQRSKSHKDDISTLGKPVSLRTNKTASEGSEPSPNNGMHRNVGGPYDTGGSDSSSQCAPVINGGPGSLASIGLKDSLIEDALNQKILTVLRTPSVVTFLREHQRRLNHQRREKSAQERAAVQQQQHQKQQLAKNVSLPTTCLQLQNSNCGQNSPAHASYIPVSSGQLPHPFSSSHGALTNLGDNYGY